jgi:hypothetical protein
MSYDGKGQCPRGRDMKGGPREHRRFAVLPERFLDALPRLSLTAAKVGIALASFMDAKGSCFPSRQALGERCGIRRQKTISAATHELESAGVLAVRRRCRRSCLYQWVPDGAQSAPSRNVHDGAKNAPHEGAKSAPHKQDHLNKVQRTVAKEGLRNGKSLPVDEYLEQFVAERNL